MEISNFRHRSSGDFLGLFSSPSASSSILSGCGGHELLESDILWHSSDVSSTSPISRRTLGSETSAGKREISGIPTAIADDNSGSKQGFRRLQSYEILADDVNLEFRRNRSFGIIAGEGKLGFRRHENSGILTEDGKIHGNNSLLADDGNLGFRRGETMTPTPFRPIPKPQRSGGEFSPARKFGKSAPIKVPPARNFFHGGFDDVEDDVSDEEEEMLPPHEIVAMKLKTTSSVLEGVGRTLKGRDLRQVRNAVWQQTGFID